ncbi:MAG: outer membrane beta-barrel protein, partial [Candidatus Omnitrophica bacterium]|nr:outer membrane beta-barrel protein [Candidatus Omnitrophota bacterium]
AQVLQDVKLKNIDLPDREGVKVGNLIVHGAFKASEELETNIYLTKNKEKFDAITILTPSVGVELPVGDHNFSADYFPSIFMYGRYNNENHVDHLVRGLGEINFTDYKIRVKDVYRDYTDRAADENSRRIGRQENTFRTDLGAQFNKLGFDVGYTNIFNSYSQQDDLVYQSVTYGDKVRMTNIVDAAVSYRIMPKTVLFVEGDLGFIHYMNSSIPPDAYFVNALLGIRGKPTNKIVADIKGGCKYQHFDKSDIFNDKPFFGFTASGGVDFHQTKDDIWSFGIDSSVFESDYSNNNSYHGTIVDLRYVHKFNKKVSISPFGAYQLNLYPSETTEGGVTAKRYDNFFATGCSLRYDVQKWLSAEVKYDYTRRYSRFSTFNYTDNKVTFSGTVGF